MQKKKTVMGLKKMRERALVFFTESQHQIQYFLIFKFSFVLWITTTKYTLMKWNIMEIRETETAHEEQIFSNLMFEEDSGLPAQPKI